MTKTFIEDFKLEKGWRIEENAKAAFRYNYGTINKYGHGEMI